MRMSACKIETSLALRNVRLYCTWAHMPPSGKAVRRLGFCELPIAGLFKTRLCLDVPTWLAV